MTNKLSKHAGGGVIYTPALLNLDGTTQYFSADGFAVSGDNIVKLVQRFRGATSGTIQGLAGIVQSNWVGRIGVYQSTNIDANPNRLYVQCGNTASAVILRLYSPTEIIDGEDYVLTFEFNGDTAAHIFQLNRVDQDDGANPGRVAPVTGTLAGGAACKGALGATRHDGNFKYSGYIGYFACDNTGGLDPADHTDTSGNIREYDASSWLFYNPHGLLDDDLGTVGDFINNGDIKVSDAGSTGHPHLGINTIGDAVAADIATDKIAWVDGVEIVGTVV